MIPSDPTQLRFRAIYTRVGVKIGASIEFMNVAFEINTDKLINNFGIIFLRLEMFFADCNKAMSFFKPN